MITAMMIILIDSVYGFRTYSIVPYNSYALIFTATIIRLTTYVVY